MVVALLCMHVSRRTTQSLIGVPSVPLTQQVSDTMGTCQMEEVSIANVCACATLMFEINHQKQNLCFSGSSHKMARLSGGLAGATSAIHRIVSAYHNDR